MSKIAYWKIEHVIGMAKNSFPVTENLVKDFNNIMFSLDDGLRNEGMMIVHEMFQELRKGKDAHKMWDHQGDMLDFLKRAKGRNNESPQKSRKKLKKNSALIFLLDPTLQYL